MSKLDNLVQLEADRLANQLFEVEFLSDLDFDHTTQAILYERALQNVCEQAA